MLYHTHSSSSLNQFQTSLASPHASLQANHMPEDKDTAALPSFGERFGHFVPRNDTNQPASPAPVRPSSHHSSLHPYSPSKRRVDDELLYSRDPPPRHPDFDIHRTKRRSEAGIWDEARRESDAYTSPGTSNTSRASTASYPRPALPDVSPSGPPTQPFPGPFRSQPALPAASPAGPPAQPFAAFSKSHTSHSRPPSWAADNAQQPPPPPSHPTAPVTSAPAAPPLHQHHPPPPAQHQHQHQHEHEHQHQSQVHHPPPPPPQPAGLPPPHPPPQHPPGPPEPSHHQYHQQQQHHHHHRPSVSADASRRPPYADSPSSSSYPPQSSHPYPEPRRLSYPDESTMPRRPPPLDTRAIDPTRPPRLCVHCQANPHVPKHLDCLHMHAPPSPGHRAAVPHHPPYGGAPSYPPSNGYPGAHHHHHAPPPPPPAPPGSHMPGDNYSWQAGAGPAIMGDHGSRRRRGNLPKESTAILNSWFNAHANYPYPKEEEKQQLQQQCGLSMAQISNWFINARRRRNPQRSTAHMPSPPNKHLHAVAAPPPAGMPPGPPPPPQPQGHLPPGAPPR